MKDSLRTSKDHFYKKVTSSKGFSALGPQKSEIYSSLIQALKTDLFQIQELINSNTSELNMYKILSKTPGLTKKLNEIEGGANRMKDTIESITEESRNVEKIGRSYGCQGGQELIQKLTLELGYSELLLKKFKDLFILMKLKLCNDDTFQDSLSKTLEIKIFFEKIGAILNKAGNENPKSSLPSITTSSSAKLANENNKEIEEFLKLNSINEIANNDSTSNKIIAHACKLINNFFKAANNNNLKTLLQYYDDSEINNELKGKEIDKFYSTSNLLLKLIESLSANLKDNNRNKELKDQIDQNENALKDLKNNYDSILEEDRIQIDQLKTENKKLTQQITQLKKDLAQSKNSNENVISAKEEDTNLNNQNEINALKSKYETEIKALKNVLDETKKDNKKKDDQIKELNKKIESLNESLKSKKNSNPNPVSTEFKIDVQQLIKDHEEKLKNMQKENASRLNTEYKDLKIKYQTLNNKYESLLTENSYLHNQLGMLNSSKFDPDSYEQVLLQQFNTMRDAFTKKVEDLTNELEQSGAKYRSEIYQMKQELEETTHLKNVFLNQVMNLQKD